MTETNILGVIMNALDARWARNERIVRIEIGRHQAAALAAALGRKPLSREPTDAEIMAELYTGAPIPDDGPYTVEEVYGNGQCRTIFGVPMVGVGEDRLVVVTEASSE